MTFDTPTIEVKRLLLYVLSRMPYPIKPEQLVEVFVFTERFTYFDLIGGLSELLHTGHISESGGAYAITEKGLRHGAVVAEDIRYSERLKADKTISVTARSQELDAIVRRLQAQG